MSALIAGAIGTYGILSHNGQTRLVTTGLPEQPGYYLKDAILTITQPDGSQRLRLIAEEIHENTTDGSYAAREVRVDYALPATPAWTLRAQRAAVPAGLETVEFSGNVEVRAQDTSRVAVIRSESLKLDTTTNIVHTVEPVEIEFAGQRLNATGLTADLREERLQLESNVYGRFQPP